MFGIYIVQSLEGTQDKAGFYTIAKVKNKMNENIEGRLYLPPYLRQGESNIDSGKEIVGFLDVSTGFGFAVVGLDDADFQYFFDADINIKKKLTVDKETDLKDTLTVSKSADFKDVIDVQKDIKSKTGDIVATLGDFEATTGDFKVKIPIPLSLSMHVHATAAPGTPSTPIAPPVP